MAFHRFTAEHTGHRRPGAMGACNPAAPGQAAIRGARAVRRGALRWALTAWLGLACAGTGAAQAAEVTVAVAANFAKPLEHIVAGFTAATGHRVKVAAGANGKLVSQITAGAPFDVLVAADTAAPRRLLAEGHAVTGTAFAYAIGRLVLWSARAGRLDLSEGAALSSPQPGKLAIANPKTAPYGAAAMEVLESLGLAQALEPRLVRGESIAQAYQFVATGNADLGFVALSQVQGPGVPRSGSSWRVPSSLHRPIRQDAVLLRHGEHNAAARELLAYLKSPPARALIQAHGYELP